jgi:ABC-type glycerol-3-phosphate transport system substrate-binding protein
MKKARFLLCMVLCIMAAGIVFAGGEQGGTSGKKQITVWSEWTDEPRKSTMEAIIKKFNDTQSDYEVVHRGIANEEFFTALRAAFTANDPPDIFQHEGFNQEWQFIRGINQVEEIGDFYNQYGSRFVGGSLDAVMYEGKYYGIPWTIHTCSQIYYNGDILQKNGIDPNSIVYWDDFLAAGEKLKRAGVTPIAYGNKFGWPGSQMLYNLLVKQAGPEKILDLCARNNGYKWTDNDFLYPAKLFQELSDKGYMSAGKASDDDNVAQGSFFAGQAAFFQMGSWFISDALTATPSGFKLGMIAFPGIKDGKGKKTDIVMNAFESFSLTKKGASNPEKRKVLINFLEFISRVPQAQMWVKNAACYSPITGAVTPEIVSPLLLQLHNDVIQPSTGTIPILEHITPPTVGEERIFFGSTGVLTGQLTAETWMQQVENEAAKESPVYSKNPGTKY